MSEKADKQEFRKIVKARITLSSPSIKHIERVASDITNRARKHELEPRGPVRLPTKVLKVTTRKTPNGEGSKTWDTYEMRIHKRIIVLQSPPALISRIAGSAVDPKVNLKLTVAEDDFPESS